MNKALEYTIEGLYGVYGNCCDDTTSVPKRVASAVWRTLEMAENAYCKEDRDGYLDWAIRFSRELNGAIQPCDEWLGGPDGESWPPDKMTFQAKS